MKTSDLMQGDWVRTNDGELRKVVTIDVGYVTLKDGDNILTKSDEHIFPIEITEDFLLNNGFKKLEFGDIYQLWLDGRGFITIVLKTKNGNLRGCTIRCLDIKIEMGKVPYVHELQHILRICNIKKGIEL